MTCSAAEPIIDPSLRAEINRRSEDEKIKINILLKEQSNPVALSRETSWFPTKRERQAYVVETLKQQSKNSQQALISLLNEMETNGLVSEIRPLWLVNSVSCYANRVAINNLAQRNDIMKVYHCEATKILFDEEVTHVLRDNDPGWPDPSPSVKFMCRQTCENTLAAGIVAAVCVSQYNDYPFTHESLTEIGLIRPDVCAPGLNIMSLDYNDDHG